MPAHPELTKLLRDHLEQFGTAPDGRLFSGVRGAELPTITYRRAWIKARQAALTATEQAPPRIYAKCVVGHDAKRRISEALRPG